MTRALIVALTLAACGKNDAAPAPAPPAPAPPVAPPAPPVAKETPPLDAAVVAASPPDASPPDAARPEKSGEGEALRYADVLIGERADDDGAQDDVVRDRITIAALTAAGDTALTTDQVHAKIMMAYMAGLKRCYRDALKQDQTLHGKLTLSFTVNETGRVTEANVAGVDDNVDACVRTRAPTWRFPPPKDQAGAPADARFVLVLALTTT